MSLKVEDSVNATEDNTSDLAVFISSKGRAEELGKTLESVLKQSLQPCQIILSVTDEKDLPKSAQNNFNATICVSPPGKTVQQNRGLHLVHPRVEVIAFLDDDVELTTDYLKTVREAFQKDAGLVGLSGHVIVNGGITRAEARERVEHLEQSKELYQKPLQVVYNPPTQGLYGCCMSFRHSVFNHIRFDERLPLYSWLEDSDIGIRAQKYGKCGVCMDARLIHLGVTSGRVSGLKFGFSQIMNPVYLASTGVLDWKEVLRIHIMKVLAANIIGLLRFDRQVDRMGRLHGNFLALGMWAKGKIEPERILTL